MANDAARVTLVAACYNHEPYIQQCFESIARQSLQSFDLIVTDDASTDGSRGRILSELGRLGLSARTVFNARNRGICATFNAALELVQTPYVAFLSTDDALAPTRLERQLEMFDEQPEDVAFIYGDMPVIDDSGEPTGEHFYNAATVNRYRADRAAMYEELLGGNFIAAPSAMIRTSALRAIGGYDETLAYEDYDVWCRLARHHRVGYSDEPLVLYRRGVSATGAASLSDELNASRRVQYLVTNVRILAKHLGESTRLDRLITGRAYSYAMEAYKLGSRDKAIYRAMIDHLRVHPSPRGAILTLLAFCRVPIQRFLPAIG
ncbi:MAG TPA: glycosyltransferase [Arachnia sp.]|nr:glycosyltransferase [Arachnia sp.]